MHSKFGRWAIGIWWAVINRPGQDCRWVLESALIQRDTGRTTIHELRMERYRLVRAVESLERRVAALETLTRDQNAQ